MDRKFIIKLSSIAIVFWIVSEGLYWLYHEVVSAEGYSLHKFMHVALWAGITIALAIIITRIILLCSSNNSKFIVREIFFTVACLGFIFFYALMVSAFRNPNQLPVVSSIIQEFRLGLPDYLAKGLFPFRGLVALVRGVIHSILDAEGLDIGFCFVAAFASRYILYPLKTRVLKKEFLTLLLAWLIIIAINEICIQSMLSYRNGSLWDVFNNALGALIGVTLSVSIFNS